MQRIKMLVVALSIIPFVALALFGASPAPARAAAPTFDAAATYKTKCAMCHGKTAEKKFDATKADDVLASVVLKGKADAKPKMPGYETKGVTPEQAAALVAHMRALKQ
jgi:mono/diheme cytochrome c family protein